MKRLSLLLLVIISLCTPVFAQTVLAAGDIAFTGFNFDNPDQFSILFLVDVAQNTQIKFTDNGWRNTNVFRTGEGIYIWTASTAYPAGSHIAISPSVVGFANAGDQILAYQGADGSPTFIAAINSEGSSWQTDATSANTSALPQGLTNGTNCVAVTEIDNATYDMSVTTGTREQLLAAINDAANWTGDDINPLTLPPAGTFTITTGSENVPPSVGNIVRDPMYPLPSQSVLITADITDSDGTVSSATLNWGTTSGSLTHSIDMLLIAGNTYGIETDIPAQTAGTTVYYQIQAVDDDTATTTTPEYNYTVYPMLSPAQIQGDDEDSPYVGQTVRTQGIVTAIKTGTSNSYFVQSAQGADNGVYLYNNSSTYTGYAIGDLIEVIGPVTEYHGLTEIGPFTYARLVSAGNAVPSASELACDEVTEDYESVLFTVEGVECLSYNSTSQTWLVNDGSVDLTVSGFLFNQIPTVGQIYNITGIGYQYDSATMIAPRSADDITMVSVDNIAPTIDSVVAVNGTTVTVTFSEVVETVSAETTGNYSILARAVTVTGATLDTETGRTVTLTVSGMVSGNYTIFVTDVEDAAGNYSDDSEDFTYTAPYIANIVINEINYNNIGNDAEWIELYNPTAQPVDLTGWYVLDDDNLHTHLVITSGTIAAYGYFTVAMNLAVGATPITFVPGFDGSTISWALANGGDTVRLYHSSDVLVDGVIYDDSTPWPTTPDGSGPTLELIDPLLDNALGINWQGSIATGGTPNAANIVQTTSDVAGTPTNFGNDGNGNAAVTIDPGSTNMGSTVVTIVGGTTNPNVPGGMPVVERTFTINPTNTGTNVTVTLTFHASELNGIDPATLLLYVWNGSSWAQSGTRQSVTGPTNGVYTVVFTGVTLVGGARAENQLVLGSEDTPLPVTLSAFNAVMDTQKYVTLTWTTASEALFAGFNVLRSESTVLGEALRINDNIITSGQSSNGDDYRFQDSWVSMNHTYYYWLEAVDMDGSVAMYGPLSVTVQPGEEDEDTPDVVIITSLLGNYPNPFNPSTTIRFSVSEDDCANGVAFSIYDVRGRLVKKISKQNLNAGTHTLVWDGTDRHNQTVSTGVYFLKMDTSSRTQTLKLMLMK